MDISGEVSLSAVLASLTGDQMGVYAWIAQRPGAEPDSVAGALGLSAADARSAVSALERAQLLIGSDERGGLVAVDPGLSAAAATQELSQTIRAQQAQLDGINARIGALRSHFHAGRGRGTSDVEPITELEGVRSALNRASEACRQEMLTCQPGGNRVPEALQESIARDTALLERGVRMRTLYQHTARFNGPSQAYVAAVSALGAEYRTAHELFGRIIVFDRETAFIPDRHGSWGAVVIREPSIVAYLCSIFEAAWSTAKPFGDAPADGLEAVSKELDRTILRLLAAGLKDEAIARRLGMSLRTLRRHIADIMAGLRADSRFQAGVRAAGSAQLADGAVDDAADEHAGPAGRRSPA